MPLGAARWYNSGVIPFISHRRFGTPRATGQTLASLLAAATCIILAAPASPQETKPAKPGFALVWSKSVEPLIAIAISPQGGYVGMITHSGKIALWGADQGRSIWSEPDVAEHNLVVSDGIGYVLTYDQMNRLDRTVTLYRAASAQTGGPNQSAARPVKAFSRSLDGAVWSAAVRLDGSFAACGTGTREVCLFSLGTTPQMTRHPIDGICNDLQFADNDQYMAIGLWNQSGVERMDMAGRIQGSPSGANNRRYSVSISPDSRRILTVSYLNPQSSDPVISLLDDQGSVLWSRELGTNAYGAAIALGSGAQISFASYTETVRRNHEMIPERNLIAIGPTGDPIWTQPGGPFFSLTLISLTPDGLGLVAYDDSTKTLYRLNSDGQIEKYDKLSSSLQYWACSSDHKRLLIYTYDGELSLLSVQ
jgi:WD40 repeat protein